MSRFLSFPNPVNETASRVVAGGVCLMSVDTLIFGLPWLAGVLALGFAARVATGPRLSPLALLSTKVIAPRLPVRLVPGPPKRFAQAIGLAFSLGATVAFLLSAPAVGYTLISFLMVASLLEAVFGLCLGCKAFGLLMSTGLIPESVCIECASVGLV